MPNKRFLEETPLYKKFESEMRYFTHLGGLQANQLPKPAIHMYCVICASDQTFNMTNEYYDDSAQNEIIIGKIKKLNYTCSSCGKASRIFLIYFTGTKYSGNESTLFLEKVGQAPAWSIEMDKGLEKMLGKHADYYKRGLICESQSYGIGAYAYFRRITEDIIDELLESISELLEGDEKAEYAVALEEAKKTRVTQEKIDLVKDLLPASLRPNGVNPLEALHSALSAGLHEEDEGTCLEYADAIKKVIIYLVNQVLRKKKDTKEFTDGMKRLLGKKTRAGVDKQKAGNQENV